MGMSACRFRCSYNRSFDAIAGLFLSVFRSPASLSVSILLLGGATFNKCTKRMTTSASGAGPAVTAKNYMPCAKVLPLHYSNIKSSRSGKSTRVAVCNFSLACSSACSNASSSSSTHLPWQSVKRGWRKKLLGSHMLPVAVCQGVPKNYTLHFNHNSNQRNHRHYSRSRGSRRSSSSSTFRLHVENGKTPLEREKLLPKNQVRATWSQCCCCSSLTCHAVVDDNENLL